MARAVLVGALVTCSFIPAHSALAQESPTTTTTTTTPPTTTTTTTPPTTTTTTTPPTTTTTTPPTSSAPTSTTESTPASTPTTPKPDPDAFAALAIQVAQNQAMLTELSAQVTQITQRLGVLTTDMMTTEQKLDATRAVLNRLRQIVRDRAAYIYRHADTPTAMVDIQRVEDISAGKKYAESATQTDGARISELSRLSGQLDSQRKKLDGARAQQQQQKGRLESAQAGLEALTTHQKKLLDEAGAISVMGDAELTAAEITAWFESRDVKYRLSGGISIGDLIQIYMEEGKAEHVRPELAFAQSIIETGSFGNALDNNYAGIGACDSCQGEPAFPTPRDGVRGQIQLLRNYADPKSRAANLANPPSPTIYGNDPVVAAQLYDTFFAKGTTPNWNAMGNGNWATDPGYAQKVLIVYFQMVSFTAKHS